MKPLRLEMTAFGSYAEKTVVPFDELEQGLCLVTGDTGAGKTTIFDAIVFALYGKASGKDRSPDMMHSDLVDRSVDTVVRLRFSQAGRRCELSRSIHFPKKRKGDSPYGDAEIQATLTGEGLDPVEGATRVSAACEALLGLNAEQFRKIVMLAQGEFRDFLKADSEKKSEILGKLFDSSSYAWYQKLLDGARRRLEQARQGEREQLRQLLKARLELPPDADPARFLPDEPVLLENLDGLLAEGRARCAALDAQLRQAEQGRDELLIRRTDGKTLNEALDRLAAGEGRRSQLDARAEEMARLEQTLDRAELALHRALPALREAARAARARQEALESLERLQALVRQREQDDAQALADRAGDEALSARRDECTALLSELEQQLGLFARLGGAERDIDEAKAALAAVVSGQEAQAERLQALQNAQQSAREGLAGLEDAELRMEQAQLAAAQAEQAYLALAGPDGIRARCEALRRQEAQLARQGEAFRACTARVLAARERSNDFYRRFLAGQAGLLAGELRQAIERAGEGLCPVCGSRLGPEHLDRLAGHDAETPTQEAVDAAKAEAEALEQDRQTKKEQLSQAHSQLLSGRELLVSQAAAQCPDCADWETLCSPGWLDRAVAEARARSRGAKLALNAAREAVERRDALRRSLSAAEKALSDLQPELEELRAAAAEREKRLAAAESRAGLLRQQLRYESQAAVQAEARALKLEQTKLRELLNAHETRAQQARAALEGANGQLCRAKEQLTALDEALRQAQAQQALALRETGFPDPEAVQAALLPCRGQDAELWLRQGRKALSDYEHEKKTLAETLELLRKQTAGRERADLEALERSFAAADASCQALRQQSRSQGHWLENCTQLRESAARHLAALAGTAEAWRRLDRLGSRAAGTVGAGGRLSFERYVMGAVFRDILEMANRRLDRISGGRYQLEHKTAASRANASAGLEVEILDLATGKRRPSASLSGGESFYTSLALALGLSDVVQAHAGGMKLEALFIDEGFGSLDEDMLDKALAVLNDLTRGERLVGIISHVDKLSASIPQKIVVKNGPGGSSLRVVV